MKPNARQLAMRDPALAALLGADQAPGADFGAEFGAEFGGYDPNGGGFGDYGWDIGADAAPAPAAAPAPSPAALMQAWQKQRAMAAHSAKRGALLEPNANSHVKIERYVFSINQSLTIGTAVAIDMSGQPDTDIRPQRVTMNAPTPAFATISEIKVANVSVTVGGTEDAFDYNANGVGQTLDVPTLSPANKVRVLGNYSGFAPVPFTVGFAFLFTCSFKGPAKITA